MADTVDHVFPASWYPDSTPTTVQHLTVPSCHACNKRLEVVERIVGHDLLIVVDPHIPGCEGVAARINRSWQPMTGKSDREWRVRAGNALKILRTMAWAPPVPGRPQVEVRTAAGVVFHASPARRLERAPIRVLAEKFLRGLHYAERCELLGDLRVEAFLATPDRIKDSELAEVWAFLESLPIRQDLGPGFWWRGHVQPDGSAWAFRLWGQATIVAIATPPDSTGVAP